MNGREARWSLIIIKSSVCLPRRLYVTNLYRRLCSLSQSYRDHFTGEKTEAQRG